MLLTEQFQHLNLDTESPSLIPSDHSTPATLHSETTCILSEAGSLSPHSHVAQFYDSQNHLFKAMSDFFHPFFDDSCKDYLCAVIIARPGPIQHFKDLLKLRGYKNESEEDAADGLGQHEPSEAWEQIGRHVLFVDAFRTLDQLMPGQELKDGDFDRMLHGLFSQLPGAKRCDGQKQGPTFIYGELVDILCERRQHLIALELEEIWNNFLSTGNFSLLCGYSMQSFQDRLVTNVFRQICRSHGIVSPTESFSSLSTAEQRMAMVAALQQNVKALEGTIAHQNNRSKMEEQQKRYQEQFVDVLCHELRNPVSNIAENVELLRAGLDTRKTILQTAIDGDHNTDVSTEDVAALRSQLIDDADSVEAIATCADHMKTVTDDLLSLSKLEGGQLLLENAPFDPKATINSVIKMFSTPAKNKGVELFAELPDEDVRVYGDAGRLAQVIINLVSNGLKFTDSGRVTISLRRRERKGDTSFFEVNVQDTGRGMCKDDKLWLFRRFSQPLSTSFAKYGGSGLGLYISRCLVELMGGTLTVISERGQGSTFIFTFKAKEYLPSVPQPLSKRPDDLGLTGNYTQDQLSPQVTTAPTNQSTMLFPASHNIKHILLCDDNPVNLRLLARLLQSPSTTISTSRNGYEAIATLIKASSSSKPIDLVLMDLEMPFLDGVSTTRAIRGMADGNGRQFAKVPIVGLTGHVKGSKFEDARVAGMDECVARGLGKKALVETINLVWARRSSGE